MKHRIAEAEYEARMMGCQLKDYERYRRYRHYQMKDILIYFLAGLLVFVMGIVMGLLTGLSYLSQMISI
jgi:hypothetical protein